MVIGFLGEKEYRLFVTDGERRQALIARLMASWHNQGGPNAMYIRASTKEIVWIFDLTQTISLSEVDAKEELRQQVIAEDQKG